MDGLPVSLNVLETVCSPYSQCRRTIKVLIERNVTRNSTCSYKLRWRRVLEWIRFQLCVLVYRICPHDSLASNLAEHFHLTAYIESRRRLPSFGASTSLIRLTTWSTPSSIAYSQRQLRAVCAYYSRSHHRRLLTRFLTFIDIGGLSVSVVICL
jgi:hypothetical protein